MKKRLFFVVVALVANTSQAAEGANWQFIQDAGGIALGEPVVENGEWALPVRCDVSGMQPITIEPAVFNESVICEAVNARLENGAVYLTVMTGPLRKGFGTICPSAKLGMLPAGRYRVYYSGPSGQAVSLGKIALPAAKPGAN